MVKPFAVEAAEPKVPVVAIVVISQTTDWLEVSSLNALPFAFRGLLANSFAILFSP
jgi:hypothetical protein